MADEFAVGLDTKRASIAEGTVRVFDYSTLANHALLRTQPRFAQGSAFNRFTHRFFASQSLALCCFTLVGIWSLE